MMEKFTMKLIEQDLAHIWHPCSQMKDYESFNPLIVESAAGSTINLADGKQVIDAVSSWWCKSLGHNHPYIKQALFEQAEKFEHVILANTTNETIVKLATRLCRLTSMLDKVFFTGDGSCAVEVALKMSIHAHQILGQTKKIKFMSLTNSYHGETCGALSVSDLGLYRAAYKPILMDVYFLQNIPYVTDRLDPLWADCSAQWLQIEQQLNQHSDELTAIIVEPILQAAGGMLIYSQDFLRRLRMWCGKHDVHLIADEIMTGLGRTGFALACQHSAIEPDFLCLGKGLTAGWLPMSAVLTSTDMFNIFYDDYATGKAFLHSHTHSGNALSAAVALASLEVLEMENIYAKVRDYEFYMKELMETVAQATGKLKNIRNIGAVVAADLDVNTVSQRVGYAVYQKAVKLGALLRPLGNTIYWAPPLNVDNQTLEKLCDITIKAIRQAC